MVYGKRANKDDRDESQRNPDFGGGLGSNTGKCKEAGGSANGRSRAAKDTSSSTRGEVGKKLKELIKSAVWGRTRGKKGERGEKRGGEEEKRGSGRT
jgi:hypothetical protein